MADNQKLYIHEFIDIVGHHRADYMYHMTANFSPMGQEDRNQLCYGVWGILGSTGRWPEVVNMWELDGFDGAVDYFRFEVSGKTMQDPRMARWWAAAVPMRSGGNDRLLVPAPWTRSSTELCGAGVGGELYAHDRIGVRPGSAPEFLEMVIEDWEHWAELERAHRTDDALIRWNTSAREVTRSMERILLIDAPLSPFRTKRQPRRSDRTVPWDEG
jgi:hypothetical protein